MIKRGVGALNLTGTNTYSGPTVIEGGTLSVSSIENGGVASGIGQASNAAGNLVLNGGALEYVGTGQNTDRLFTLGLNGGSLISSGPARSLFYRQEILLLKGLALDRYLLRVQT